MVMSDFDLIAIQIRLGGVRAKLKAREGQTGYKANCDALRDEIARLEGLLAG